MTAAIAVGVIALAAPAAIADTTPIAIDPHGNITTEATSSSGAVVAFTVTSNVTNATITCTPLSGSVFPIASTTVNCTAVDNADNTNTASASFSVAVQDTVGPSVAVPGDITQEATSSAGRAVTFSASATDAVDGSVSSTCNPSSGSTFPLGQTIVTCTASDTRSNPGTGTFKVTIVDTTAPVLNLPGNQSVSTASPGGTAVSFSATATDAVDGSISATCSPTSGSTFAIGTTTVNCHATDAHGNTSNGSFSVVVTLTDTTPPVVSVPGDIIQEAGSSSGASVTFSASANDNADGPIDPTCSPSPGATFPLGATTVVCHATDAHGNTGTGSFKVTIRDTTKPSVQAPPDTTQEASSSAGAVVIFSASATDTVDGVLPAPCSPASGSTFRLGSTTVTCHATDAHGNVGTDSFSVTVVDTTAPTLHLPSDIATTTSSLAGAPTPFSATATDAVDGSVSATCSPAPGSTFSIGTTTVNCHATDAHNNTSTGHFSIAVAFVDTTPPVVNVPSDITNEAGSSSGASVTFSASANDNADGPIAATCSPSPGATFPLGTTTVACHATDAHGNTGTGSFKVTIKDTTVPVVHVPADLAASASSADGAKVSFASSADDTVDGQLSTSCTPASDSEFSIGTTTVKCTATDAHGNTGSATFHVTVADNTGPSVTVPTDLTREANGPGGALVTFVVSATDAVDGPLTPAVINCLPSSGFLFPIGTTTVTCTASDSHSNTGQATFKVIAVDTTPPRLNVPAPITMTSSTSLSTSDPTIASFLGSANATDLVDGKLSVTNDAPNSFPIGTTSVTFTAVDKSGHKTVASSSVTLTVAAVPPPPPSDAQPPAPVGKLAARASSGTVALTWVLPTSDFDHVVVEESSAGSSAAAVYTGSATSYNARGLKNGVEYRFVVVSFDKTGNASAEVAVVATPAAAMLVLPKDGAVTKKPPTLTWRPVEGASYYNVQLYRLPASVQTTRLASGSKVLSVWPTTRSLRLAAKWVFQKKTYKLSPGTYRWFVWPGFGPRADVKYGPVLGESTFVVRGG